MLPKECERNRARQFNVAFVYRTHKLTIWRLLYALMFAANVAIVFVTNAQSVVILNTTSWIPEIRRIDAGRVCLQCQIVYLKHECLFKQTSYVE